MSYELNKDNFEKLSKEDKDKVIRFLLNMELCDLCTIQVDEDNGKFRLRGCYKTSNRSVINKANIGDSWAYRDPTYYANIAFEDIAISNIRSKKI